MTFPHTRTLLAVLILSLLAGGLPTLAHADAPSLSSLTIQQAPSALANSANSNEAQSEIKSYTLPPALYDKAVKFSRAEYILYFADFVWGVVVLLLVLRWLLAPRYRDFAERITRRRFLQAAIYSPALLLTIAILGNATSQIWWLTLLDCEAIAFALLIKGGERARRPNVRAIRAIEPETLQEPREKSTVVSMAPPRRLREPADL